jgi:hypothetical protein
MSPMLEVLLAAEWGCSSLAEIARPSVEMRLPWSTQRTLTRAWVFR